MAVIAANATQETLDLINQVLATPEFVNFSQKTNLKLSDNTTLLRLALVNLIKNIPNYDEVLSYKLALLNPHEFNAYLKQMLGIVDNVN